MVFDFGLLLYVNAGFLCVLGNLHEFGVFFFILNFCFFLPFLIEYTLFFKASIIIDFKCCFFHFVVQFSIGSERKAGIFVVRSDARVSQVLKTGARKHELLITNAVAVSYLITPIPFLSLSVFLFCIWFGIIGIGFAWCHLV